MASRVKRGRVRVNVGGTVFETTMETLCRVEGTMLDAMVSERWRDNSEGEDAPEFFIDRDPTHFRHILNFLRDGTPIVPRSDADELEIAAEAKFYGLNILTVPSSRSNPQWFTVGERVKWRPAAIQFYAACNHRITKASVFQPPKSPYVCPGCNQGLTSLDWLAAGPLRLELQMALLCGIVTNKEGEHCFSIQWIGYQTVHVYGGFLDSHKT